MACLDTTFLIDLSRRHGSRRQRARDKVVDLLRQGERLVTTRFNVAELYVGVFRSEDKVREEAAVAAVLAGLGVLDFDDEGALIFSRVTAHLQETGRLAGDMDVLIGATALAANERVVTRNTVHFADIPGLVVESY